MDTCPGGRPPAAATAAHSAGRTGPGSASAAVEGAEAGAPKARHTSTTWRACKGKGRQARGGGGSGCGRVRGGKDVVALGQGSSGSESVARGPLLPKRVGAPHCLCVACGLVCCKCSCPPERHHNRSTRFSLCPTPPKLLTPTPHPREASPTCCAFGASSPRAARASLPWPRAPGPGRPPAAAGCASSPPSPSSSSAEQASLQRTNVAQRSKASLTHKRLTEVSDYAWAPCHHTSHSVWCACVARSVEHTPDTCLVGSVRRAQLLGCAQDAQRAARVTQRVPRRRHQRVPACAARPRQSVQQPAARAGRGQRTRPGITRILMQMLFGRKVDSVARHRPCQSVQQPAAGILYGAPTGPSHHL